MVLGRAGLLGDSGGPPTWFLSFLQLNQNLHDVLVSLEKQHGSNTFTVKAQPRCVMSTALQAAGGCGRCGLGWASVACCSCKAGTRLLLVVPRVWPSCA